jgi:lipopolysaccharide/colanic/teichoic acid biosynthesis glycosyltransferase
VKRAEAWVANGAGSAHHRAVHADRVSDLHLRADVERWEDLLPRRAAGLGWRFQRVVKRVGDVVLGSLGLLVLAPLLLTVAVLIRLTSRGPVFYRSTYVGYRGTPFTGYKFRSMVADADQLKDTMKHLNHMRGPAFKIRNDPRVTPLGRFLRKFSIDELPQLWNVVKGDMSLVGPRPPLPTEYREFLPWQRAKLAVCPGITCYWQIQGRSEISDFDEWARLDLKYIEEWNLWTDLKILLRTIPAVVRGHGAY